MRIVLPAVNHRSVAASLICSQCTTNYRRCRSMNSRQSVLGIACNLMYSAHCTKSNPSMYQLARYTAVRRRLYAQPARVICGHGRRRCLFRMTVQLRRKTVECNYPWGHWGHTAAQGEHEGVERWKYIHSLTSATWLKLFTVVSVTAARVICQRSSW